MRALLSLLCLILLSASAAASFESELLAEINLLRTNPKRYADYLRDYRKYYQGNLKALPGGPTVQTKEGVSAVDEAIAALEVQAPVGALTYSNGLSCACRDHMSDQGKTGRTGHDGSDGSSVQVRIQRYGQARAWGENIMYGPSVPREIVMDLVIDDGVPDRGHRTNFFSPEWDQVGFCLGSHPRYRNCCVIDFAGSFAEARNLPKVTSTVPSPTPTSATRPPVSAPGTPFQAARGLADAHYQAAATRDREAWLASFTPGSRGLQARYWNQMESGCSYTYSRTEQLAGTTIRFRYLRRNGSQMTPCFITVVQDNGRWLVEEATY